MKLSWLKATGGFILAAMLSVPAWAANAALPGTLNYVEGEASVGDQPLNAKQVGSVELQPGQRVDTQNGKAEILLTPGVFLRVGSNSAAQLVSSNLTDAEARLDKGQALVEVDEIHKDNLLRIASDGATTELEKDGVYGFDADNGAVRVYKGEALVQDGDQSVKVKGGRELDLNTGGTLKAHKFDEKSYENADLYRFSNLRAQYLSEANVNVAQMYYAGGPGWYWDPFFTSYTWVPGNGILYSPFGWGFYSPGFVYAAPIYYRGYYGGRYGPYLYPHVTGQAGVQHAGVAHSEAPRPSVGFRAGPPAGHFGVMGGGGHSGGFHR